MRLDLKLIAIFFVCFVFIFSSVGGVSAEGQNITEQQQIPQNETSVSSTETIGYWGGVWYNESFEFDNNDSAYVNNSQIEDLTNRTIARIEVLRNDTFNSRPQVNIITREQYQQDTAGYNKRGGTYSEWNNIVWKSTFIVEDGTNVESELQKLYGGQVRAFYSPDEEEMYVIVDQDQTDVVQFRTTSLAHELVHAYQDQKFNLGSSQFQPETQDGSLSSDSIIEGESVYLEEKYKEKCQTEWDCYIPDGGESTTSGEDLNIGLQLTAFFPYSDGHSYIKHQHDIGGWDQVNKSYQDPPTESRQIIHYRDAEPSRKISVEQNSSPEWDRFNHGVRGSERVGEATLAIMFWYQNRQYGTDAGVDVREISESTDVSQYNYNYSVTRGLESDVIVPYRHTDSNQTGYVFKTQWENSEERREFMNAYDALLKGHNAEVHQSELSGTVYAIKEENGYSGIYYINETETEVTVTHSQTVSNIKEIRGLEVNTDTIVEEEKPWYKEILDEISLFKIALFTGTVFGILCLTVALGVKHQFKKMKN